MTRLRARVPMWVALLVVGVMTIPVGVTLKIELVMPGLVIANLVALAALIHGVRRNGPSRVHVWWLYACSVLLFLIANCLHTVEQLGIADVARWDEIFDLGGFGAALVATLALGKVLDAERDPTSNVDAWIITLGSYGLVWTTVLLPLWRDPSHDDAARFVSLASATCALGLIFAISRLTTRREMRYPAAVILGVAAVSGAASQSLATAVDDYTTAAVFAVLALLSLASAASHPSMTRLTVPVAQGTAAVTKSRSLLLLVAVAAGPGIALYVLIIGPYDHTLVVGLIVSSGLAGALVVARLSGLARAHERVAHLENTLGQAMERLAAARTEKEVQTIAVNATGQLLDRDFDRTMVGRLRRYSVSFVNEPNDLALQLKSLGADRNSGRGSSDRDFRLVQPLSVGNDHLGAICIVASRRPKKDVLEALSALAVGASMALNATRAVRSEATLQAQQAIRRDLHDDVQQRLLAMRLRLSMSQGDPPSRIADQLETGLMEAISALRTLVHGESRVEQGDASVQALIAQVVESSGLDVVMSLDVLNEIDLTAEQQATVYFITCESLNNVMKHARASRVELLARWRDEKLVEFTIRDDGRGNSGYASGFGIRNMQLRASALGGSLAVEEAAEGGTIVVLTFHVERKRRS